MLTLTLSKSDQGWFSGVSGGFSAFRRFQKFCRFIARYRDVPGSFSCIPRGFEGFHVCVLEGVMGIPGCFRDFRGLIDFSGMLQVCSRECFRRFLKYSKELQGVSGHSRRLQKVPVRSRGFRRLHGRGVVPGS